MSEHIWRRRDAAIAITDPVFQPKRRSPIGEASHEVGRAGVPTDDAHHRRSAAGSSMAEMFVPDGDRRTSRANRVECQRSPVTRRPPRSSVKICCARQRTVIRARLVSSDVPSERCRAASSTVTMTIDVLWQVAARADAGTGGRAWATSAIVAAS